MTNAMQQHGAFSWCELMTTDTTAAKEFYSRLFGWEIVDRPVEGTIYSVLNINEQGVGGLMAMPPDMSGIPPHWGVYVTVDDVDAAAKLVADLGGQIKHPPSDIPDVGRFAVIQDPQGAILTMISYSSSFQTT